ncbi:MAG: hypothetical protein AMXMBFR42_03480 [Burkholderiales bacterium]
MLDRLAVLVRRDESARQPEIVHVDRLVLHAVRLQPADRDDALGSCLRRQGCVDAGFFPGLLREHGGDARSRGDAAADEVVEQARIDRLRGAAPRDPHRGARAFVDEAVHVDRRRVHAEVARRGAFQQEGDRSAGPGTNVVAFVAPRAERTLGRERPGDARHRRGAIVGGPAGGGERDPPLVDLEDVVERRDASGTFDREFADGEAVDVERNERDRWWRERAGEPRVERG